MYSEEKEKLREDSRERDRDEKRRMLHPRARCARSRSILSSDASYDGCRILSFLITHARTYTRPVSPSQPSLNIQRGLSGREIGSRR